MIRLFTLLLCACCSSFGAAPYLLQTPAYNGSQIVFSLAGDLWTVPAAGGEAMRLTTGPGEETRPFFSPDGSQIAFSGEYDGNADVFVMPAAGGLPRRVTWHPDEDEAVGWTPDGKRIVFTSGRSSPTDLPKLFAIPAEGGFPEELPFPSGSAATWAPDGKRIAYAPGFVFQSAWKRYRGGQTRKIWIGDLADSAVTPIPRENSNDFNPMWVGGRIYFLSDRNGPVSLFSYDTATREVKQLIENWGLDFKWASAGPDGIVYEQFGALHIYDWRTEKSRPVEVRIAADFPEVRPRFINVGKRLGEPSVSPTGVRAVFGVRGEIVTVPAEKADPRNLTNTPGVNEREPAWSPDGKTIAYVSDESGEYALHLRAQSGAGETRKLALDEKPGFYFAPRWSPNGKKIAYLDNRLGLWYVHLDDGKPVLVDRGDCPDGNSMAAEWSPDSRWLGYAKKLKSGMHAIYVYSLQRAAATQVTDGMSDAANPVFDKNGRYLYFTASTDSGPASEIDTGSYMRSLSSAVYVVVLSKSRRSPFAPETADEGVSEESQQGWTIGDVQIDLDRISQRILAFGPERRYGELHAGKPGILYAVEFAGQAPDFGSKHVIHKFDIAKRRADPLPLDGVHNFQVSFNGEKVLYQQGDKWVIASAELDEATKRTLNTDNIEVRIDPRAEWRQMYHEAWRNIREFFYDPDYHGLDLRAAEERYQPYLENLASRRDLNYLFTEAMGELSVGHLFVAGGDLPETKKVRGGLLGADCTIENGRYRFARIYDGENWNPSLRAPLTQPGLNVTAGEYLLGVNGRELRASDVIYSFFEGTADQQVAIRVGPDPSGANSREITVRPVDSEQSLRRLAWVEGNRRKVEQMTGGRVAYVHLPDTGVGGNVFFNRYFYAQVRKEGIIIDDRFNHGGHFAYDLIDYLRRSLLSMASLRYGGDWFQPHGAIYGPKVMIVNEYACSGGDALPWYFRRAGIGKLVGTRTWGGLIGLSSGVPELMDGGVVTVPNPGFWSPDGQWEVENHGVAPDIEVELDPKAVRQGHDPQLEKSVQVVLEELEKHPVPKPVRPPYPNYHVR